MSFDSLRKGLPPRALSYEEDRDLQLQLGRQLSHAQRFRWLCRTVEELRYFLGRARASPGLEPSSGEEAGKPGRRE